MSTVDCVDPEALERLYRIGGAKLVGRMIDAFMDSAPVRLADARAGLAAGQAEPVGRAAHSLKSTAGNFGGHRVQTLAQRMEEEAGRGDLAVLGASFAELEVAMAELVDRLERERERCRE